MNRFVRTERNEPAQVGSDGDLYCLPRREVAEAQEKGQDGGALTQSTPRNPAFKYLLETAYGVPGGGGVGVGPATGLS